MKQIERRQMIGLLGAGGLALAAGSARADGGKTGLKTKLTKEYGVQYPFVGAGMGFVALPPLVAAVTNAGGIGVLGNGAAPPPATQQMIRAIRSMTDGLFGVDFIHETTAFGPATTDDHISVAIAEGVKLVVFHWNPPTQAWVNALHAAGARVWFQTGLIEQAEVAVARGVDAIVAQGSEAGGHVKSATGLSVLIPEMIDAVRPALVLAAGGIGEGRTAAAALAAGAAGVWVGTRLIASVEAYAHAVWKQAIVEAKAKDTVITTMFGPEWPGAAMRVYRNRVVNEWAGREHEIPNPPPPPAVIGTSYFVHPAGYPMPKFSSILPTPDVTGDFKEMCLAMGQSCSLVNDIRPAGQIVQEMMAEAQAVLGK